MKNTSENTIELEPITKQACKNVPRLRFKEFTKVWECICLDEIQIEDYDITYGVLKPGEYNENGIPMLQIKDILSNKVNLGKLHLISESLHNQYKRTRISKNDLVISVVGTIGTIARIPHTLEGSNIHRNLALLKINDKVSSEFIFQNIISEKTQRAISQKIIGSTQDLYNLKDLRKLEFHLPILAEQQKIANFLTTIDSRIEKLNHKKELMLQYKKGVMQKIFSQEIRFKQENGKDFPKWEVKRLGDVTDKFSKRNKNLIDATVYSVTNSNGFVPQTEHFDKVVAGNDLSNYKVVEKNDFAYNPARINVGSIAHFKDEVGVISSLYVCFKTTSELLDSFLLYILDLEHTKYQINNLGEGGVRIYLWYDLFALIKCKIPSIEEQKKIIEFLNNIDTKIGTINKELEQSKTYKKGLLQQMFV